MRFIKMHGIGNDYVFVDCHQERVDDPAALSRVVSRPHTGIGSDGLVLIEPSDRADLRMRIFNADGSQAEMCGNASRCVGKYAYEYGLIHKTDLTLETLGGIRDLQLMLDAQGKVEKVRVDMGVPRMHPGEVGVNLPGERIVDTPLPGMDAEVRITCVSLGNPHGVIFVKEDPGNLPLEHLGPQVERHPVFPNRINVELIQVLAPDHLRMRVWERGSGETQACGSGASAALVAAHLNGLAGRRATVSLLGGELEIAWDERTDHVFMTGGATIAFMGDWLGEDRHP